MDGEPKLSDRLRESCVSMRQELQFSRHLFRGKVSYIARDPITFDSHRLDRVEYEVLVQVRREITLGKAFENLVKQDTIDANQEEEFYELVVSMHQIGFLALPMSDGDRLYKRYLMKKKAAAKGRLMSLFFLPIPLVCPDQFLDRTLGWVSPLFSKWAQVVYCLVVGTAGVLLYQNWYSFAEQLEGFFTIKNLFLLWGTMIMLKVLHEFGHAFACKYYGGHVPEMGVYLIVGTPSAYVDATASWGFTSKWQRLVVSFAGMYVELFCAAVSVVLWCVTDPGLFNAFLHNVILLASAVTIGFNANPLMRFDGYYAFSDAVEIPNLRGRATQAAKNLGKKLVLGISTESTEETRTVRVLLIVFGLASVVYKLTVVLSISAMIATKFLAVGLALGSFYLLSQLFKALWELSHFLLLSEETARLRLRGVLVASLLVAAVGFFGFYVPYPVRVDAAGVVGQKDRQEVRIEREGFLHDVYPQLGSWIEADSMLISLRDPMAKRDLLSAQAKLEKSAKLVNYYAGLDRVRAEQERASRQALEYEVAIRSQSLSKLELTAPISGKVVQGLNKSDIGRFLKVGETVALIASGAWQVTVLLTAEEFSAISPLLAQPVEFRSRAHVDQVIVGLIVDIDRTGSNKIDALELTDLAGGAISINPLTQQAQHTYYRLVVELQSKPSFLRYGMTGSIRFEAESEPFGTWLRRKVLIFVERLRG